MFSGGIERDQWHEMDFKQSKKFNGDCWNLIERDIFYRTTFNIKMIIFDICSKFM